MSTKVLINSDGQIMDESLKTEKNQRYLMALAKLKSKKQHKVDITDYQDIADCIRSDQVSAPDIVEYFSDKTFYKWYSDKYFKGKK
jgi:hypothetical protein